MHPSDHFESDEKNYANVLIESGVDSRKKVQNINNLLTESEGCTGKYQTEALVY